MIEKTKKNVLVQQLLVQRLQPFLRTNQEKESFLKWTIEQYKENRQ